MSQNLNLKFNLTFSQGNQEHNILANTIFDRLVGEHNIPMTSVLEIVFSELFEQQLNKGLEPLNQIKNPKEIETKMDNLVNFSRLPEVENLQELSQRQYFDNIRKIINYFFEKIPTNRTIIDNSRNLKQIELLINKDNANTKEIMEVIDFIANDEELKKTIKHPYLLRQYYKKVLSEMKKGN